MPTAPDIRNYSANNVDLFNAIRNDSSANYRNFVPVASPAQESVRTIGTTLMNMPELANEFIGALINRIAAVRVRRLMFTNPWKPWKKGSMDMGDTIEEVYVNLAKPFAYDMTKDEGQLYKRELPDVRSAFHVVNYRRYYKDTIDRDRLRAAFLSWESMTSFISEIIGSMYASAEVDEFEVMKYLIAVKLLKGEITPVQVSSVSAANMASIVTTIKATSNKMVFPSTAYNRAHVKNAAPKDRQYLIGSADFDATMDVNLLAAAFNMDKAEFTGRRVLVDGFGTFDEERLARLIDGYQAFSSEQKAALNAVPAVLIDDTFFQVFDNLMEMKSKENEELLYWNYWLHTWKTVSASPFANAVAFVVGAPGVTSVTVTPATATVTAGQTLQLTTVVATTNFASQEVTYTAVINDGSEGATDADADPDEITITPLGLCTIGADVTANSVITVTATSVADSTATDTCVITVA